MAKPAAPKPVEPTPEPAKPEPPKPTGPQPPMAEMRSHDVVSPHGTRNDPYYWLRDDTRKDPAVLAYLTAENAYTAKILEPAKATEETLFTEMRGRVAEDDSTVPTLDDGYWYYTRYEAGKQYPIYARKQSKLTGGGVGSPANPAPGPTSGSGPEQILLDGNELAKGHSFFSIASYDVTRDGRYLAYTEDTVGRRQFTLRVKDLQTGTLLPDTLAGVNGPVQWSNDGTQLFLVGKDPTTLREDRIIRLPIGGAPVIVYQEPDASYYVGLARTKSKRYLLLQAGATTESEIRLIDADKPLAPPRVFFERSKDHEYSVDHLDGKFVILTNWNAKNFRVMEVADSQKQSKRENWKELVAHRPDTLIRDVAVSRAFLGLTIQQGGMRKVEVHVKGKSFVVDAPDPTYAMTIDDIPDPATKRVRYTYNSMTRPSSVYELDVTTKQRELKKQQPVPGYDPELYTSEYLQATATDGTKVPISVVYKKTTKLDGTAPLLVYGYGSYGVSLAASYTSSVTSLLDRGWVYAIAHIRGGQELGRAWYEAGKLLAKKTTFTDFIAATEHLISTKHGDPKRVFASGRSAGGLLMGAITNLRPDLYRGIVAGVPFVDVVTTMMDATIPLTTNEYDEWGNPADKKFYDYMLSYSPMDNIQPVPYPAIYCETGLWDSQVQYYEPAKWVARLRAITKPGNPILLDTDMTSGHGGASGRFDKLHHTARTYAFLLMVSDTPDPRR